MDAFDAADALELDAAGTLDAAGAQEAAGAGADAGDFTPAATLATRSTRRASRCGEGPMRRLTTTNPASTTAAASQTARSW